jgi:Tol biopolymer transport system component/DNA-binding winged helix-turn-helix (wHTH) protein
MRILETKNRGNWLYFDGIVTIMIFRFDSYTLDSDTRTLSCRDTAVALTPKVFQALLVLVENSTRVMSKAELFERLWPQQVVEEANLTQTISMLRKALEEAATGKRYIATFHGHGYRFVEPVIVDRNPSNLEVGQDSLENKQSSSAAPAESVSTSWPGFAHDRRPQENDTETSSIPRSNRSRFLLTALSVLLNIAVFVLLFLRGHDSIRPVAAQPLEITTLTRMEGSQYQPSWSRDGKELAFVDTLPNNGNSSIYVQVSGDVKPRELISGAGSISSPVWSPDGRSLAFIRTTQDTAEILIFSLRDSISRKLTALFPHRYGLDYRRLDWSPDGNFLVVNDKINDIDPLSLYLVHVSDGKKLRLTYPNMDIIGDVAPRFSPDGAKVAFIRVKYQFQEGVFVLPVTGGEARQLTDELHVVSDVDWQTNDSLIFNGRLDDEFRFWRRDIRIPNSSAMLVFAIGTDLPSQFSISRQSGQIAFSTNGPDLNIWSVDLTTPSTASTTWNSIIDIPGQDLEPSISFDGSKMAFRSDQGGHIRLWVSKRDGTEAFPVNTGGLEPSVYCWERNGRGFIFSPQFDSGLFEASVSPSNKLRRVTDLPLNHPSCSVDGKSVFAISSNFVYRVSIPDGAVEKITDDGGAPIVQSTDGRYLYFAHGRMDSSISRLDLLTRKQTVVVDSLAQGYSESWALMAKGIIFLKMDSDGPTIAFHEFATGRESVVTKFKGSLPPVGLSQFSISPDERTLFVVRVNPVSADIQSAYLTAFAKH